MHKLGVSGSTILSNSQLFSELFWDGVKHIEIGEFSTVNDLYQFIDLCKKHNVNFGIHSPLLCGDSKYDLIEKVQYNSEYAWMQIEQESKKIASLGAKYLLVHFPYFKGEALSEPDKLIEDGLKKLSEIQKKYSIEIVCEPKLGLNRSANGINYLNNFPIEIWRKYDIKLCIDIGDYIIAVNSKIIDFIAKWSEFIKVVHLHNVLYEGDRYIWTPVHPTQECIHESRIKNIVEILAQSKEVLFVFEHTPDVNPSKDYVYEGYRWIDSIINQ